MSDKTKDEITTTDSDQVKSPKMKGDFAEGERTEPAKPEGPDFARGERTEPAKPEDPDFARGERTEPAKPEGPDYARGERTEPADKASDSNTQ